MKKEFVIKKCAKCGAIVEVIKDCHCKDCGVVCCGESMQVVQPNSVDAAFEKHVPTYQIQDNQLLVTVNHVMDADHYIEWVAMVTEDEVIKKYLQPGQCAQVLFAYVEGARLYAYCNKHGLWETQVK